MKSILCIFFFISFISVVISTNDAFAKEARELFKKHKYRLNKTQLAELNEPAFEESTTWIHNFIASKIEGQKYKFWMPVEYDEKHIFSKTQLFYVHFKLSDEYPDFRISFEQRSPTFGPYAVVITKKQ